MTNQKPKRAKYVQHFSTRIPWKDNGFTGKVDDNPKNNVASQVIPNIASLRDLEFEDNNKGMDYLVAGPLEMQHWITENAAFMSETKIPLKLNHPYKKGNEKFNHFEETLFELQPYSFLLRPFSWTLKDNAKKKAKYYNFHFDLDKTERMLTWNSSWVSHGDSQKGIFDYFFSGVKSDESIIFPYYKQVPFIEDNRRVIAGIGNIISPINIQEYDTDGTRDEKNYIWETNAAHSIREGGDQGFLMPYLEIEQYAKLNPDFDVSTVTIFEPTGFRDEFSYAAEWVSFDATIDVLNQTKIALKNIADLNLKTANRTWVNTQLNYVEKQKENVWNQRGIYPGLGAMLSAFGVKYGFDISTYIDTDNRDLITELGDYFSGDKEIGDEKLDESLAEKEDEFNGLLKDANKIRYFDLLARINLSVDQALFAWEKYKNQPNEVIENPYRLYELSRKEKEVGKINISQIENAVFTNKLVINNHPLKRPSKMRTKGDKRRFRAMVIFVLSQAADRGHTFLSYDRVIDLINKLPLDYDTDFSVEKIHGVVEYLQEGDLYVDETNNYIKLLEYQKYKELVLEIIKSRLNIKLPNSQNWREVIDEQFGQLQNENEENDQKAREEKANALVALESSKLSVLIGRAGTGKTSALGILASSEEIRSGGVLALTPTGKARVQLENSFKKSEVHAEFITVAQFLTRSGGFSWDRMSYRMPEKPSTSVAQTVIIDESSMLTEDMFAGILKLVQSHAHRIIFIGDPNQLPPIGAGRPFVDLINYLKHNYPNNLAELQTEMRQGTGGYDLSFAQLFSNADQMNKDIVYKIQNKQMNDRLKYIQYDCTDELEESLLSQLVETLEMNDDDDVNGFNKSLGAEKNGKYTNYKTSRFIEDWQILSPTKFVGSGSYYLNNQIHQKYRQAIVENWNKNQWSKKNPQSVQNIVYGDKVISNTNGERKYWDGSEGSEYIANGEIGLMSSFPEQYGKNDKNKKYYKFRFGSFEGKVFSYTKSDFGGENNDTKLELAYALTVHKAQGSSFGKTIVVINGRSSFLTKELLYTAFSRQKEQLIILSDLSVQELVQYSSDWYSDTKQRYTDLFEVPNLKEIEINNQKRFFENNLIHKTVGGELVRSKSEVIVANILNQLGIEYTYEEPLRVKGKTYMPDFTIRHQGRIAYIEHLGMLNIASYKRDWDEKRNNYEKVGISEKEGNLIITKDGLDGSLDALEIENKITSWINE
ncbi:AAA family ATPase [Halobacillus halophilus]|uniref:AAA family ATPase n=1 Tax=Halobacillus halophilus TaxID=1570 RepID=UPI001CD70A04|nr:AAA family ATPase [Halobacillus halophilus]MCA1011752.1 AAA family ATPase [Halobacillus halophilus]